MTPRWIPAQEVARHLTYDRCIPLMREAMIALSQGRTRQLLRSIIDLAAGRALGIMPGATRDVTIYKSLGSIVQDLAAAQFIPDRAMAKH